MLDPAFVRDHPDLVAAGLRSRGIDPEADLAALAALEARRRALIPEMEGLKQQQNRSGEEVAKAKREGRDPTPLFAASKERGQRIKALEADVEAIAAEIEHAEAREKVVLDALAVDAEDPSQQTD